MMDEDPQWVTCTWCGTEVSVDEPHDCSGEVSGKLRLRAGQYYRDGNGRVHLVVDKVTAYDAATFPVWWTNTGFWYWEDGRRMTYLHRSVISSRTSDHLVEEVEG